MEKIDKVIFSGSLSSLLRNSKSKFPNKNFLKSCEKKYNSIKNRLNKENNKIKIGFSWFSKRKHFGEAKSIKLNDFLPIFNIPNFLFINLQYDSNIKDIKKFSQKKNLNIISIQEIDLFNDLENTSALLSNLDLFITISSTTAHLAGALGVPTYLIKPKNHASFHYWFQPSFITPWYHSVKLFSQKKGTKETIQNIKKEIEKKFKINA